MASAANEKVCHDWEKRALDEGDSRWMLGLGRFEEGWRLMEPSVVVGRWADMSFGGAASGDEKGQRFFCGLGLCVVHFSRRHRFEGIFLFLFGA